MGPSWGLDTHDVRRMGSSGTRVADGEVRGAALMRRRRAAPRTMSLSRRETRSSKCIRLSRSHLRVCVCVRVFRSS